MNKLSSRDYTKPTKTERIYIIELLERNGINIESDTWAERNDNGDYESYPNLIWTNNELVADNGDNLNDTRELTIIEFLNLAGIPHNSWGSSELKHYFI